MAPLLPLRASALSNTNTSGSGGEEREKEVVSKRVAGLVKVTAHAQRLIVVKTGSLSVGAIQGVCAMHPQLNSDGRHSLPTAWVEDRRSPSNVHSSIGKEVKRRGGWMVSD